MEREDDFMSMIRILDDHLINKIAAGEVVERPASVVKELVENAIDAGSTHILVRVEEGGVKRIEVEDDGCGIPADEIETAFLRHATSKIREEDDLYRLDSLGFRGEALPSIASVSRVELHSAVAGLTAWRAVFHAGKLVESAPVSYPAGTRMVVEDLFFNTPVRKKYLKSTVTEFQKIYDVMQKLALSRTQISFEFQHNQKHYFKTPGNGNLIDTIASLWGADLTAHLLPVNYAGREVNLHGLISRPDFKKNSRRRQYLFINGRSVFSPLLNKAVEDAYQGLLGSREFPVTFLFLDIERMEVDCNVHPQKLQVKFRDDGALFRVVRDVVRAELRELFQQVELGSFAQNTPAYHPAPAFRSNFSVPGGNFYADRPYPGAAFAVRREDAGLFFPSAGSPAAETVRESPAEGTYVFPTEEVLGDPDGVVEPLILGQVYRKYILAEVAGRFWLIDQHAAHERIHYERILAALQQPGPGQMLLIPQTLDLSPRSLELWAAVQDDLTPLGFAVEPFGDSALIIRALPGYIQPDELDFEELLQLFADQKRGGADAVRALPAPFTGMAASLACKKAIKAKENLSREEMRELVAALLQADDYQHCPHGRPTFLELSETELDKHFKRIV
jgi:DNA mismatch repair protein MutL